MNNQVAKIEKAISNLQLNDIREKTDFFHDSLVAKTPKARLPESIFRSHFLPYFAGQTGITKDSNVLVEWISVAGSPMSEVDVIDQNQNVLFTVPALFDTNIIEIAKREAGKSLADIYQNFELRNNNIPAVAQNYLSHALADKLQEIQKPSEYRHQNEQRWTSILEHYGVQSASGKAATSQQTNDDHDDVVYE